MPKTRKAWIGLTAIVALILAALGWFLVISPKMDEASTVREETASLKSSNDMLAVKVASLKEQYEHMDEYRAQLAQMQVSLPETLDQSAALRELQAAADANGVPVTNITFDPAVTLALQQVAAATPSPEPSASASDADSSGDDATAEATPAPTSAASGAPVYAAPVTFTMYGTYEQVTAFLDALQGGTQRYFLVGSLTVTPQGDGASIDGVGALPPGSLQVDASAFVFVYSADGTASAIPPAPSADPSADPSATPAPTPLPSSGTSRFGTTG